MIELRTLGGVDLRGPEGRELRSIVAGPKRLALLAYLALQSPSGYQRRDTLLGLFWPELDQDHARNALRNALSILRHGLGSGVLVSRGDEEVGLEEGRFWCDTVAFERALEAGKLEEALALYRGDLLEGFFVSGAPEFEHWLEGRRTGLRELAARAAWELAERQEADGNVAGAGHWARRAGAFAPYDEDVQRRLIELLDRVGDRAGALAAYEAFVRRLRAELDVEPMPETRALMDGIRAVTVSSESEAEPVAASGAGRESRAAIPGIESYEDTTDTWSREASLGPQLQEAASIREEGTPVDRLPPARGEGSPRIALRPALLTVLACVFLVIVGVTLLARRGTTARGAEETAAGTGPASSPAGVDHAITPASADPAIAVLPFQVNAAALEPWREGMVDLLSINLDGIHGLRAIDSRTVLARWREGAPAGVADLATTLKVARRTGARYALVGSAVAIGPDVRFVAEVYDANAGKIGVAQVQGSPDSVFALVDGLSVEVLRQLLPKTGSELPRVDLGAITTRSPMALKAWLEGERLWRRSDWEGAQAAYKQAAEADSTFALPLVWLGSPLRFGAALDDSISRRLAGQIDRLRPRDALLVRAYLLLAKDNARDKLRGLELLKEASRRFPDNPDAWYQLGEAIFHAGPHVVKGIEFEENDQAFSRTIELDSTYALAYIHPLQMAFSLADSARAADLIRAYRRLNPIPEWEWAFALAFGDSATRLRTRAALDTIPTWELSWVKGSLTHPRFRTVEEEVLETLLRRPDDEGPGETRIITWYVRLGSGKLRQALEMLDDPPTDGVRVWVWAAHEYFPYAMGLPIPPERLDRDLVLGESDSVSDWMTFYAGAYAADRGRWAEHAKAVSRLRHASVNKDIAPWWAKSVAEALEGYGLWRRGRREEALHNLEVAQAGTMLSLTDWRHWLGLRTINSWHGRLLLELGRPREAVPYFKTTFSYAPDPLDAYYLGRAYEASNQPEEARNAYEYFAEAWKDADPELRPMVEEARAAAARLTKLVPK